MPLKFWEKPVRKSESGKYGEDYSLKPDTDSSSEAHKMEMEMGKTDKFKPDAHTSDPISSIQRIRERRKLMEEADVKEGNPDEKTKPWRKK